jgi:hypothetical protein
VVERGEGKASDGIADMLVGGGEIRMVCTEPVIHASENRTILSSSIIDTGQSREHGRFALHLYRRILYVYNDQK